MATERYQYAVTDDEGVPYVMPERMAQAVVAALGDDVSMWRRVERVDSTRVTHGEWHEVETPPAGGA